MKMDMKAAKINIKLIWLGWGVACCIAALFIPHYDFGFDGVKVWFYLCLLMFVTMIGGALLIESLRHQK